MTANGKRGQAFSAGVHIITNHMTVANPQTQEQNFRMLFRACIAIMGRDIAIRVLADEIVKPSDDHPDLNIRI